MSDKNEKLAEALANKKGASIVWDGHGGGNGRGPGTWFKLSTKCGRLFRVFLPAPHNSRSLVYGQVALFVLDKGPSIAGVRVSESVSSKNP